MTEQCCVGGPALRRPARRLFKGAASILPGAALAFLPKCPLCLAAWLTAMTGIGFSAAGAVWVGGIAVLFWIAAVTLFAAPIIRRRAFGRAQYEMTRSRWRKLESTYAHALSQGGSRDSG